MPQKGALLEIFIEKLSYGGAGIGREGGKVIFVKDAVPGDVVYAEITEDKKNYSIARVINIKSPSGNRVQPPCPVFGKCGGCDWQQVEYRTQLTEKENIVRETVERIGKIKEFHIEPAEASIPDYGYRSKLTLSVVRDGRNFSVSFFEAGTDTKISVNRCPVANENVNTGIRIANEFLKKEGTRARSFDKIYIATGDVRTGITLSQMINRKKLNRKLDIGTMKISGNSETEIESSIGDHRFISVPSVFMQANPYINRRMVETVLNWTGSASTEKVLDLYCGIGNFTIPVSEHVRHITGVDSSRLSVKYAEKNAAINKRTNTSFTESNVEDFLKRCDEKFNLVILDPPREGARNIISVLEKMHPEKIIYISCNPATMARDIHELSLSGYSIKRIKPFDMFPHTYHIEVIALLESGN